MQRPLRHSFLPLRTGVTLHYAELPPPDGAAVRGVAVLCHGFPDTWYGWRKQIHAVADCGYHVLVPDMPGYGDSSAPKEVEFYSQEAVCASMVALLDALLVPHAVFIGHDWGGTLVWNMAIMYPQRVSHVAAVCTPFLPQPAKDPWPKMKQNPGRFDYQVWFQCDEAQTELEADAQRSVRAFLRAFDDEPAFLKSASPPTKQRGIMVHLPRTVSPSRMLTADEEAHYVGQFRRSGFFGPLSWYRNVSANWKWVRGAAQPKVLQESMMITAAHDRILTPTMARKYMPPHVLNCRYENVDAAGHWVLQERPEEVNAHLRSWLLGLKPPAHIAPAKL
eukprot:TRINITY_DN23059_c0_g1_i1.p2 TRINITY_DN23059_c0_g1~~TRINITY_DN23059_c0_g1_i1.p2  ORF type:complete len:358 (+),score=95.42 TRINITY_DN23059_c0_g1_i1:75-1076(+)